MGKFTDVVESGSSQNPFMSHDPEYGPQGAKRALNLSRSEIGEISQTMMDRVIQDRAQGTPFHELALKLAYFNEAMDAYLSSWEGELQAK